MSMLFTDNLNLLTNNEAHINNNYGSVAIKLSGAYITELKLNKNGMPYNILFCDSNKSLPKINASHPMCPVGKYTGLGGQHGFPRRINYKIVEKTSNLVKLAANGIYDGIQFYQEFAIDDNGFWLTNNLVNKSQNIISTSTGEHFYFNCDNNFSNIAINNKTLDKSLGKESIKNIRNGIATHLFRANNNNVITINETKILLQTESSHNNLFGLSFWQRENTKSFCIEPTIGYVDDGSKIFANDLIILNPGEAAYLKINIKIV
jgi:galactose mutarotase-like enzyme